MKNLILLAIAALTLSSCQNEDDAIAESSFAMKAPQADYSASTLPVTTVTGEINSNTTWDNDHVWEISGVVRVTDGATLTIEPGTFIKAASGDTAPTGVLVITKTGQINAVGTAANPIVFTSYRLLDGASSPAPQAGDFAGVVLLGDAPTNTGVTTNVIEGLDNISPVSDFQFGGSNSAHDAGTMQYVRIEFAGSDLEGNNSGNEINGLTFGAVGNGTTIDHIQVSYGLDDGLEFFGGTVNVDHIIVFAQDDDGLDFDLGYTGSVTKALVLADENGSHSQSGGNPDSNGIELDNNGSGTTGTPATLITRPVITDLSIIGFSSDSEADVLENGIHVRRLGEIDLTNATVTGYPTGIYVQSPSLASNSSFSNFRVHGFNAADNPASVVINPFLQSTANPAEDWGLSQPFFNDSAWSLAGNTGAFANEQGWATDSWTNYNF